MEAASAPTMHLSRDARWLVVASRRSMVPAGELLSAPSNRVRLGGGGSADAGRPGTTDFAAPSQAQFLLSYSQFRLVNTATGETRVIDVPTGGLSAPSWSPGGRTFVFSRTTQGGVELWAADVSSTRTRQLTPPHVHLGAATDATRAIGSDDLLIIPAFRWIDDEHFIYRSVPDRRPRLPARPLPGRDPIISEVRVDSPDRMRTDFASVAFASGYDDLEYDYYETSHPRILDIATGRSRPIGPPAPYIRFDPSPSGQYFLTQRRVRPYPRDSRQPHLFVTEILDRNGNRVSQVGPAPAPLAAGGIAPRPRNFAWGAAGEDQLFYVLTAQSDSGARENRLMRLTPPFTGPGDVLLSSSQEIGGFGQDYRFQIFSLDRDRAITVVAGGVGGVSERAEMWLARTAQGTRGPRRFLEWQTYGSMESFSVSVAPVLTDRWGSNARARSLVSQTDWIYLRGNRPDGRGYLDRINVETSERQQIFLADPDVDERLVAVLDPAADRYITIAQTADAPPKLVLHCRSCDSSRILYQTEPNEAATRFGRELIAYRRADGLALQGELFTPSGYRAGQPVPVIVVGYPIDTQPDGQVVRRVSDQGYLQSPSWTNPNDLVRALLARGYAVFRADMPLTGGRQANDNLGAQLVQNASAAVDLLVERGIAQRGRIGVVGHSFGGTMVATLLANSDLFAAGVAMNGFYNWTDSPFRLQLDTRTLWEAPDTWLGASALFKADRIRAPLLLVHGQLDGNVPADQAVQMYRALSGLGRDARLVLFPDESHNYGSREAQLTIVNEMLRWFDRYLGPPGSPAPTPQGSH
jgi:dipeptidyl aminopeptidase/acylaminoacyl peptidase